MLKPLLRTSPLYSGNVKIACHLRDYKEIGKNHYLCNIRYAKLYPLSHQLFQKNIECGLLGSTYDFDLKRFYERYSDYFYENCFEYLKNDMSIIDCAKSQYQRNTDFEYGVKRISYEKTGYQYAFFAPIYIESEKDIPVSFNIRIKLSYGPARKTEKLITINLNDSEATNNYIGVYLKKYAKNIDSDVCFISQSDDSANYSGIDLIRGGFTLVKDNSIYNLFKQQNTLNNFDASISFGFKRNKLAIKQILPLCFMFNVEDILTGAEKSKYLNCDLEFSGYYIEPIYNKEIRYYDFSFDYDNFYHDIMEMDPLDGMVKRKSTSINIMDVNFPGLNEKRIMKYQFSNKLTPMFSRWKMKYSDDDYPYITNVNYVFSKNQDSPYKYREFPTDFINLTAICNTVETKEETEVFNFMFPIGETGLEFYKKYNPNKDNHQTIDVLTIGKLQELFESNDPDSPIQTLYKYSQNREYTEMSMENKQSLLSKFYKEVMMMGEKDLSGFGGDYYEDFIEFVNSIVSVVGPRYYMKIYRSLSGPNKSYGDAVMEFSPEYKTDGSSDVDVIDSLLKCYDGRGRIKDHRWPKNFLFMKFYDMAYKQAQQVIESYEKFENTSTIDQFKFVRNNYACEWFSLVENVETSNWWENAEWRDVQDDKCYYRGILYDFTQVYNILKKDKFEKIDKFGVFLYSEFKPITQTNMGDILYADWTVARTKYSTIGEYNADYNYDMLVSGIVDNSPSNYMYYNEEMSSKSQGTIELQSNKQYVHIPSTYLDTITTKTYAYDGKKIHYKNYGDSTRLYNSYSCVFLSLEDTNILYSDVNKYYDVIDINYLINSYFNQAQIHTYLTSIYPDFQLSDTAIVLDILTKRTLYDIYNPIISYEMLPVYYGATLANKNVLNTSSVTGEVNSMKIDSSHFEHGHDLNGWMDNCYSIIADSVYMTTRSDNRIFASYKAEQVLFDNITYSYTTIPSYIWAGPIDDANSRYGVSFLRKGEFVKSSNIEGISYDQVSNADIENFITQYHPSDHEFFDETGAIIPISISGEGTNRIDRIASAIHTTKDYIGNSLSRLVWDIDEYEFNPITLDSSEKPYITKTFTKRSPETSRYYGDKMEESELPYDHDCLWIDTYNLANLFEGKIGKKNGEFIIPEMPDHVKYMLDEGYDKQGVPDWRKEYYARFTSKEHVYHYYIELCKDPDGEYPLAWTTTWLDHVYVKLRRLVNNESISSLNQPNTSTIPFESRKDTFKISIKDQYMTLREYMDVYCPEFDYPTNFVKLYNDNLQYNPKTSVFSLCKLDKSGKIEETYGQSFELCFKKLFIRMNSDIYDLLIDLTDRHPEYSYRDLYIYRLETVKEWEDKFHSTIQIEYVNLEGPDWDHLATSPGEFCDLDQYLVAVFNDIFEEKKKLTLLYSSYLLNSVTKTEIIGIPWGAQNASEDVGNNAYGFKDYIYRLNKNQLSFVIEVVPAELPLLIDNPQDDPDVLNHLKEVVVTDDKGNETTELWYMTPFERATGKELLSSLLLRYDVCKINFYKDSENKYDQLKYISESKNIDNPSLSNENISLMTMKIDDVNYGFYLLHDTFDNTLNSFRLNSMIKRVNAQNGNVEYVYGTQVKMFNYMNGYNLTDISSPQYYQDYAIKVIRELLPFMRINLLDLLNSIECIVKPRMYSLQTVYTQDLVLNDKVLNPQEIAINYKPSNSRQTLLRYMNSIVPLITPSNGVVRDQYSLKFKNVDAQLTEYGTFKSIGDSVIYSSDIKTEVYHPIQIYTANNVYDEGSNDLNDYAHYNPWYHVKSYNMNVENFVPLEYKHYNISKCINLSSYIEYEFPTKLTYSQVLENEKEEKVFETFTKLFINIYKKFDDAHKEDFARYLYSKYKVEYDSVPVGLNFKQTEKLYRLTFKFYLL